MIVTCPVGHIEGWQPNLRLWTPDEVHFSESHTFWSYLLKARLSSTGPITSVEVQRRDEWLMSKNERSEMSYGGTPSSRRISVGWEAMAESTHIKVPKMFKLYARPFRIWYGSIPTLTLRITAPVTCHYWEESSTSDLLRLERPNHLIRVQLLICLSHTFILPHKIGSMPFLVNFLQEYIYMSIKTFNFIEKNIDIKTEISVGDRYFWEII